MLVYSNSLEKTNRLAVRHSNITFFAQTRHDFNLIILPILHHLTAAKSSVGILNVSSNFARVLDGLTAGFLAAQLCP